MSKQTALDAMVEASRLQEAKPPEFLTAWKDAVYLAGVEYFVVTCDSVGQATDKNQLRPDLELIFQAVAAMSTYEQIFILSLCQFYSDSDVRNYCDESGMVMPSLADIANLSDERRNVIVALLNSYSGW